jgi:two-component system chemotaxis response regulator CheB
MPPVKALVVDDSPVVRRLVSDVLSSDREIEVVGTAGNGKIALEMIEKLQPDVVTLDVEMPVMDGLTALTHIRRTHRRLPVIMLSTLTMRGAAATLDALARGATDYIAKPSNMNSPHEALAYLRTELVPKVKVLGRPRPTFGASSADGIAIRGATGSKPTVSSSSAASTSAAPKAAAPAIVIRPRVAPASRIDVITIGTSTGGPNALETVIGALPGDLPVPVLVVQHMPPMFTRMLAERLDTKTRLTVVEAEAGMTPQPGWVYIAPGDNHLVVVRDGEGNPVLRLNQDAPENSCRPAVDVLFRSVAACYRERTLAVVMTGMGHDGLAGARSLITHGVEVLVQDEATSVVWGMPGAIAQAGLASELLPLERIAAAVEERLRRWPGMRVNRPAPDATTARPAPSAPGARPTPSAPGARPAPSAPGARPTPSAPGARPTPTRSTTVRPAPAPATRRATLSFGVPARNRPVEPRNGAR